VGFGFLVGTCLLAHLFDFSWLASSLLGVAVCCLFCGSFLGGRVVGRRRGL
jgi:hypothetical protein